MLSIQQIYVLFKKFCLQFNKFMYYLKSSAFNSTNTWVYFHSIFISFYFIFLPYGYYLIISSILSYFYFHLSLWYIWVSARVQNPNWELYYLCFQVLMGIDHLWTHLFSDPGDNRNISSHLLLQVGFKDTLAQDIWVI